MCYIDVGTDNPRLGGVEKDAGRDRLESGAVALILDDTLGLCSVGIMQKLFSAATQQQPSVYMYVARMHSYELECLI